MPPPYPSQMPTIVVSNSAVQAQTNYRNGRFTPLGASAHGVFPERNYYLPATRNIVQRTARVQTVYTYTSVRGVRYPRFVEVANGVDLFEAV